VANVVSATRSGEVLPITVVEPQRLGAGFMRYQPQAAQVAVR